jgi:hypothetical protein
MSGDWRKLHNEDLHNLYSLQGVIRMIKPRKIILDWHVAQIWEKSRACSLSVR